MTPMDLAILKAGKLQFLGSGGVWLIRVEHQGHRWTHPS
jgi:hypothetical protein